MARPPLPTPLGRLLEEQPPDDVEDLFEAVTVGRERRRRRSMRHRALGISGGALACAAAAAALWMLRVDDGDPRGAALGLDNDTPFPATLHTTDAHRALALSDGSWVTLAAGSRLDLLESSQRVFSVALRHGRARFDLRPQGPRVFRVECGRVTAEVVGTAFVVERDGAAASISVLHGAVLVTGEGVPDRVQRLGAGERLAVPPFASSTGAAAPPVTAGAGARPSPSEEQDAVTTQERKPTRHAGPARAAKSAPARWQLAAADGRWAEAFDALEQEGFGRAVRRARTVEELLQLADVARLSGHPRLALTPLERIVQRHPGSSQAGLAAFTRGRVLVDRLGDPAGGARDIDRALSLGLPQALAENARARLVEAHARAGQTQQARRAAAEYRARHPEGAHSRQVDRWSPR